MITLWGYKGSGSAAVEIALTALNVNYDLKCAAQWGEKQSLEQLKQFNPLGQIPTLVLEDGTVMTESAAILIHLGLMYPNRHLLPQDEHLRAKALRGLVYIPANCYALVSILDYPQRYLTQASDTAQNNLKSGTRERLAYHWGVFTQMFPPQEFLLGNTPGALDYLTVIVSRWGGAREAIEAHYPEFYAYLMRVEGLPEVSSVIARHWGASPQP